MTNIIEIRARRQRVIDTLNQTRGKWMNEDCRVIFEDDLPLLIDTAREVEDLRSLCEEWETQARAMKKLINKDYLVLVRARDRLWCEALIQTLDRKQIHDVTSWFSKHRPDKD